MGKITTFINTKMEQIKKEFDHLLSDEAAIGGGHFGPLWELILDDAERAHYRGLIAAQVLCGAGEYDLRVVSVCNKYPLALVHLVKRTSDESCPIRQHVSLVLPLPFLAPIIDGHAAIA